MPPFALHMRTTRLQGPDRDRARDAWVRAVTRAMLRVFSVQVVVDGAAPRPTGAGRVIVANHRSAFDIGVLLSTFGGTMVSRDDLADWPLIGTAARLADTVFVDRSQAHSGATTLRLVRRRLGEGRTVHLFPEGTTYDGDEVRPFRPGAFVAAVAAKAEILPVGLAYPAASGAAYVDDTFGAHVTRLAGGRRMRMVVAIGAPIVPEPGERAAAVSDRVHAAVQELVGRARAIAGE
jgi:1-acyl-sn-glycerol-3-phosphate acyltransferase